MICCSCKYEHKEGVTDDGEWSNLVGDEKFIEIKGHGLYRDVRYDYHPTERREIDLRACPKCGNIQVEI